MDAGLGVGEDFADLDSGYSGCVQGLRQGLAFGRADQEASGGLRVVEDGAEIIGDLCVVFDQAFGEGSVVVKASGDVAGVDAVEGPIEDSDFAGRECGRDIRGKKDLAQVTDEAEAGDIGHGVDEKGLNSC